MRDLQARANPCNTLFITRNEQESGLSPLVGSLQAAYLSRISEIGEALGWLLGPF